MLRIIESKKPLERLAADLEKAVVNHQFGILGVHDLRAKMAEKGVELSHECRVYEVCNPQQAKKVLEANLEISTALPCRISLYERQGRATLATIMPTALLALYQTPALRGVAEEIEAALVAILKEAAE